MGRLGRCDAGISAGSVVQTVGMWLDWIQRLWPKGAGSDPLGEEQAGPGGLERRVAALERQLAGLRWLALVSTLALLVVLNEQLGPLDLLRSAFGAVLRWLVFGAVLVAAGYGLWRYGTLRRQGPSGRRFGPPPGGPEAD